MTLQQEAYREIDTLSDENVRFIIELIRKIQPSESSAVDEKARKKADFLASAGKIDVDEEAMKDLRKRSMI